MVEMPYGPSISPCENSSTIADDGSECVDNGVVADKNYTFTSLFKVLKSFPTVWFLTKISIFILINVNNQITWKKQVENISVRIIVRQKLDDHKKLRLYRKHPGPMLFCILIENVDI